jgi:hypothetical protein
MKKLLLATAILAVLTSLVFLHCTKNIAGGTEVGNPSVAAMLYEPDGTTPAVGAKVKFYPFDNNPFPALHKTSIAIDSTVTDSNGRYGISTVTAGTYNIIGIKDGNKSILDSIIISPTTPSIPADTLLPTGSIKGVVRLRPEHSSTNVYILIFGTNTFTSPIDSIGNFTLDSMAGGTYRVKILTTIPNYVPLDTSFSIRAEKRDTLADTIRLRYTGIPVVTGLKLSYDTMRQIVTLTWSKADTALAKSYNVYRRNVDSNTVAVRINASPVADTVFSDSTCVQDLTYEYRVAAIDSSSVEGVKSIRDLVKIVPWVVINDSIGKGIGAANGQFTNLQSFTVDSNGNFYTVDYGKHLVQVFSKTGSFIRAWGGLGSDSGKFNQPYDIAIDKYGSLYVADGNNNRIQKFDSLGNFISSWGSLGTGNSQFNKPCRITIFDTLIYVGQWNQPRIQKFTLEGLFLSAFGSSGQTPGTFKSSIHGLSADSVGNIYVFDRYSLQKFDPAGNFLEILFSFNDNQQYDFQGSAMGISRNTLYITSMVLQEVVGYDLSGHQVSRFKINDIPSYVIVSNDRIFVSIYNGYIYLFNRR